MQHLPYTAWYHGSHRFSSTGKWPLFPGQHHCRLLRMASFDRAGDTLLHWRILEKWHLLRSGGGLFQAFLLVRRLPEETAWVTVEHNKPTTPTMLNSPLVTCFTKFPGASATKLSLHLLELTPVYSQSACHLSC